MTSSVYDDRTYTMLCTDENGNIEEDRLAYFKTLKQGHTAIIGPDGNPISDYVPSGKEGLAIAEIDLEKIIDYKYLMDGWPLQQPEPQHELQPQSESGGALLR